MDPDRATITHGSQTNREAPPRSDLGRRFFFVARLRSRTCELATQYHWSQSRNPQSRRQFSSHASRRCRDL